MQVQSGTSITTKVVTTGLQNDTQTEILTGLNEGDAVVISTTTATTTTGGGGGGNIPGVRLGG